jgi:membrane-associated protease RseP (regulator of RpoE activity)
MFGEPAPSQGDLHFRLLGLPIRIHPFFWIVAVILGANRGGVPEILIWVTAVFISILIHELGHALVIKAYGFRPWIVLYGMGGLACHDPAENYNSKANTPLGQISISFAGPLAGFILAAVLLGVLYLAGFQHQISYEPPLSLRPYWVDVTSVVDLLNGRVELTRRAEFVNDIFFISIFWGLLNLLPIYPLDGGHIIREILLYVNPRDGIQQSLILSIFTAALFAVFGLMKLHDYYIAIFFAFMAYESFMALQAYSNAGRR